ncbi:hypothetical protein NEMBOFW57_002055 [Staphylotrichum longicolle]|uniref:Azaphilone pigments biosynthesis cluster protein L N-terminal domain-containing protein n=1 Tax=Staphylotrichum longicolle TaxID=669026 RepID=A0AAD4HYD8_9PEZI|nr:hypothetical protein NEMBOFW57_002055 [Staphylotrichum longicolle]
MDPVSAGSGVLAFVVLALKSAKVIHAVLSAVKDGPQSLKHLVSDIASLQGILEDLSSLQHESINVGDARALEMAASRCADDVAHIEAKLQRLSIQRTDKHVGKLWKRLVTAISERDLIQMQGLVRGHFTMLQAQLGLSQSRQLSQVLVNLKQLQEQVAARGNCPNSATVNAQPTCQAMEASSTSDPPGLPTIDLELEQRLSRLIQHIGKEESMVESENAQQIIDDVEAVLQAAERNEFKPEENQTSPES